MSILQFLFFFLLMLVVVKAVQRRALHRQSQSGHKDRNDDDVWSMNASGMSGMGDMGLDCGACGFDGLETDEDRLEKAKAGVRENIRQADARIEVLEGRIRKLERTVTDRSYRLSEEIENL